jgi:hypothetical protein
MIDIICIYLSLLQTHLATVLKNLLYMHIYINIRAYVYRYVNVNIYKCKQDYYKELLSWIKTFIKLSLLQIHLAMVFIYIFICMYNCICTYVYICAYLSIYIYLYVYYLCTHTYPYYKLILPRC